MKNTEKQTKDDAADNSLKILDISNQENKEGKSLQKNQESVSNVITPEEKKESSNSSERDKEKSSAKSETNEEKKDSKVTIMKVDYPPEHNSNKSQTVALPMSVSTKQYGTNALAADNQTRDLELKYSSSEVNVKPDKQPKENNRYFETVKEEVESPSRVKLREEISLKKEKIES